MTTNTLDGGRIADSAGGPVDDSARGPVAEGAGGPVTNDSRKTGELRASVVPLREQVIDTLTDAIIDRRLGPGQRLVERELMEQLKVSRATVREALRELASSGLVTVVPQRGAFVSSPTLDEARDLFGVRAALESLIVERFVERADDAQVDALSAAADEFTRVARESDDIGEVLTANDRFYDVLLEGADSSTLRRLVESIRARVRLLRATSLSEAGRGPASARELARIAGAVRARDARRAAKLAAAHVRNAAKPVLEPLTG